MSGGALIGGYATDLVLGDPAHWHPVSGFGRVAVALEQSMYAPTRRRGIAFAVALVVVPTVTAEALARAAGRGHRGREVVLAVLTWVALGGRSLRRESARVIACVERGELDAARRALRALCGRDAAGLDAAGLSRATVESLAENTSDAVVGALLWAALAGPAGVVAYRAVNTLDAMVGHPSERYQAFGWASAKLDDAMNWPAARVAAALACLAAPLVGGSPRSAWATVRRDGGSHPSPNAGLMEAAFAGALGVRLGGALAYGGRVQQRPPLGHGRPACPADVPRARRLSAAVGIAAAIACDGIRGVLDARAGR
jgi:adenosylcobinamide-phosphate synthase